MFNAESRSSRLVGAILMIAGCCIGAGMLGLPLVTTAAGLLPTEVLFVVSWLFMAMTGLLLLEVNLWFGTNAKILQQIFQKRLLRVFFYEQRALLATILCHKPSILSAEVPLQEKLLYPLMKPFGLIGSWILYENVERDHSRDK